MLRKLPIILTAVYLILVLLSIIAIIMFTYITAHISELWAIPVVIMGLSVLAGRTWLFVHWRTNRVETTWPGIGTD